MINNSLNKVAVIAPHDRMNYGDFLFALMLDYALSKEAGKSLKLKKYSLVEADYSHLGAYPSSSYRSLHKAVKNDTVTSIIVGGGQVLGGKWFLLYSYINPLVYFLTFKMRFYKSSIYTSLVRRFLGGKSEYPFSINKNDFKPRIVKSIYNSVGTGALTTECYRRLKEADYISVRDNRSLNVLESKLDRVIYLVPDSAIILSDVYAEVDWELKVRRVFKISEKPYVFFQLSLHKYGNNLNVIILELENILKNTLLSIVLCPIGTAEGHNDDVILKRINNHFTGNERVRYIDSPSIEEIIFLIKQSDCYIGTSLHGIITAMSYCVPYIGLNPTQKKIVSYLETWSIQPLREVYSTDNFCDQLITIINSPLFEKQILDNTKLQKELYYQSINRIYSTIVN